MWDLLKQPTGWAAIAASFSAIAAFLTWRIHRKNMYDSTKPVLVIDCIVRRSNNCIIIKRIRNIGKGHATSVIVNVSKGFPQVAMSTLFVPLIPANEVLECDSAIIVDELKDDVFVAELLLRSFDSKNYRHSTYYKLYINNAQSQKFSIGKYEIASGVYTFSPAFKHEWLGFVKLKTRSERLCRSYLPKRIVKSMDNYLLDKRENLIVQVDADKNIRKIYGKVL